MMQPLSLASLFAALWWAAAGSSLLLANEIHWSRVMDLGDLNAVRNHFGGTGALLPGDYNADRVVDLADLNLVRNQFGADSVRPSSPTVADTIQFTLLHPGGSNACQASVDARGQPTLSFDFPARSVEVFFDAAHIPGACPRNFDPVNSLAGEFGPLSAGVWTLGFEGEMPMVTFLVEGVIIPVSAAVPEPASILLALLGLCLLLPRCFTRHGNR